MPRLLTRVYVACNCILTFICNFIARSGLCTSRYAPGSGPDDRREPANPSCYRIYSRNLGKEKAFPLQHGGSTSQGFACAPSCPALSVQPSRHRAPHPRALCF